MLQKVLVVIVGLVMSLVGALAPSGLFASQPGGAGPGQALAGEVTEATLATVRTTDGQAFARVSVLWVEVDGRRVTDDAWGTGSVGELRFKIGVKGVEGAALAVGPRLVDLRPTDVVTVRMFDGDFSYRGIGTTDATLQLQGTVKTTVVNQGAVTNRVRTQADPLDLGAAGGRSAEPAAGEPRVAYVVLTTGERVDTVAVEGGGSRLFTQDAPTASAAKPEVGNLLAKWVKIDGKIVREYTWGDGPVERIEFEPAEGAASSVTLTYNEDVQEVPAGERVLVQDFVGEHLVYQVPGGLMRLRLDGYARAYASGAPAELPLPGGTGSPNAWFSFHPPNPKTTDVVTFQDESTDDGILVFRLWDFGDDSSTVLERPTHRFRVPGTYEVRLNVTDNDLQTHTVTRTITVRNAEPVPDFDFSPKVVTTSALVSFTDLSTDPDGSVRSWQWDFGDGATSSERHPAHRFQRGGNLTVTLTVTDELGGTERITRTVFVRNAPPLAGFAFQPGFPLSQERVQFLDNSSDLDGQVVSWNWSFGDGTWGSGSNPVKSYDAPGTYNVRLTVTDDGGDSSTWTRQVSVRNRAPVADFRWSPEDAGAKAPVSFVSEAYDPDGVVLLQTWDWGDGSSGSIGAAASHNFPAPGVYEVTLTVTDNLLETTTVKRTVQINNSAPRPVMLVNPNPAFRRADVQFSDQSHDRDGDAIVSRVWDFGDGNGSTERAPRHAYDAKGVFPVTLTVTDAAGKSASLTQELRVLNRPPIGSVNVTPRFPLAGETVWLNATGSDPDTGNAVTFRWRLPDGNTSTDPNVTFVAQFIGEYVATLVVVDDEGTESAPIQARFQALEPVPVAAFSWSPTVPTEGQQVNFTDLSTSLGSRITRWLWEFKDGTTSTAQNPKKVFTAFGTNVVTLRVWDERNNDDTTFHDVYVNAKPRANFDAPSGTIPLGTTVQFRDASVDPDGHVTQWHWDFGDGATSTDQNASHAYDTPGAKVVTLTVHDNRTGVGVKTAVLSIDNTAPVARWHIDPATPLAGQEIRFVSTSYDPDGATDLNHTWTFPDGVVKHGPEVTHSFPQSGRYRVILQVSDGALKSRVDELASQLVTVGADHPVTLRVFARMPDERQPSLSDPRFDLALHVGNSAANVVNYDKASFSPDGNGLSITLQAGTWVAGDTAVFRLRDAVFMATPLTKPAVLTNADGITRSPQVTFDLPLPLDPTLLVDPGSNAPLLDLFPADGHTSEGHPLYTDVREAFHGSGTVLFRDGAPAAKTTVEILARYVPAQVLNGSARDTPGDNTLMGWCRAHTTETGDDGTFTWRFRGQGCLASTAGVYPVGRWEVRALVTKSFATPGEAGPKPIYVDPTGGTLANLVPTLL